MVKSELPSCICIHDDWWFLGHVVRAFAQVGPVHVFVSELAWDGSSGDWQRSAAAAEQAGAQIVVGRWPSEHEHRVFALAEMLSRGYRHVATPDGDEIPEPALLKSLATIAKAGLAEQVRVHIDTYWKSVNRVIRPRENFLPIMMVDVNQVQHEHIREYSGGRQLVLPPSYGVVHHLSYVGPDERIERKIGTTSHRDEIVPHWFNRVWRGWDNDPTLGNLHPTHPGAYGWAEHIHVPPELAELGPKTPSETAPEFDFPRLSVVIPVYGGEDVLQMCLESLEACRDLIGEVIVVDDCSPDAAAEVAASYEFVTLIRNEVNLGFAASCNRGYGAVTGEIVVFLNSDTLVPRVALIRLIESLLESKAVGAAGPLSNVAAYHQGTTTTYTSLSTLDLFAQDMASRLLDDLDVDILVGLCLAVRKEVMDEVGGFDECFGIGFFEDNDLSYRIRRAGFRLKVATRSFIHHFGSHSMRRHTSDAQSRLEDNKRLFESKWREDIQSGFASHLSGQSEARIVFNQAQHPTKVAHRVQRERDDAQISLCMIVRDEERVLADCLASATPYFCQVVVIDTGSTDRTIEVAKQFGAEVHEMPWPDSFAEARNESLKHAEGKWIFWLDADDTMPPATGHAILHAARNAREDVGAFVVPVQFVDQGPNAGTRVDHVKLLRNHPKLRFEGRIHEQVLGAVRELGWTIARIESPVLHSGYDTSESGQAKKRERDWHLLNLDLVDRPNHPFVLFNCGMTSYFTGEYDDSIQWLESSINRSGETDSHLRKAYVLLGMAKAALGRDAEAIQAFTAGLDAVKYDPELHFQRALARTRLGDLELARDDYLAINEERPEFFSSYDVGIQTHKKWHNLAGVLYELGHYSQARSWWERAASMHPPALPAVQALFASAIANDDAKTARTALDIMRRSEPGSENLANALVSYASWLGVEAEELLRKELREQGMGLGAELVLARLLLNQNRLEEARPVLAKLASAGVAEAAYHLGVMSSVQGKPQEALVWMEQAEHLNPGHEQTRNQLTALKSMLA